MADRALLHPLNDDFTPAPQWERLDGESSRAFDAFARYRDAGPRRSLRKLAARETSSNLRQLQTWSARWNWLARCAAFDDHANREAAAEVVEAVKRHRRLSLASANLAMAKAHAAILELDPSRLRPSEIAALMSASARIERLGRAGTGAADVGDLLGFDPPLPAPPSTTADIHQLVEFFVRNPRAAELADELDALLADGSNQSPDNRGFEESAAYADVDG